MSGRGFEKPLPTFSLSKDIGEGGVEVIDYFVTYYDAAVFDQVAVTASGILSYRLKSDFVVSERTYMNIVCRWRNSPFFGWTIFSPQTAQFTSELIFSTSELEKISSEVNFSTSLCCEDANCSYFPEELWENSTDVWWRATWKEITWRSREIKREMSFPLI